MVPSISFTGGPVAWVVLGAPVALSAVAGAIMARAERRPHRPAAERSLPPAERRRDERVAA